MHITHFTSITHTPYIITHTPRIIGVNRKIIPIMREHPGRFREPTRVLAHNWHYYAYYAYYAKGVHNNTFYAIYAVYAVTPARAPACEIQQQSLTFKFRVIGKLATSSLTSLATSSIQSHSGSASDTTRAGMVTCFKFFVKSPWLQSQHLTWNYANYADITQILRRYNA